MPRRNDIQKILVIGSVAVMSATFLFSQGVVDCISPPAVHTAHLRGRVTDPSGVVIPNVSLSLVKEGSVIHEAHTDGEGRFSIDAPSGLYELRARYLTLREEVFTIRLGSDLGTLFHHGDVNVFLGLGMGCPFATTSEKEAQKRAHSFNNHS